MTTSLTPKISQPHLLARLGRWCVRRRKLVVFGIWIPLLVGLSAGSGAAGTNFHTEFKLPNGEAREVFDLLKSVSKEAAGFDAQIVFYAPNGVNTDAVKAALSPFFEMVEFIFPRRCVIVRRISISISCRARRATAGARA